MGRIAYRQVKKHLNFYSSLSYEPSFPTLEGYVTPEKLIYGNVDLFLLAFLGLGVGKLLKNGNHLEENQEELS